MFFFFLFLFFLFLFCPCAPVCVIYSGIFKKSCEDEHKTHDQVNINGLYVRNSGKRRSHPGTYGSHRKNSCDTLNEHDENWLLLKMITNLYFYRIWNAVINCYKKIPKATLALVASWLIQNDTHESITIKIDGRYVWNTKYPMLRWSLNDNDKRW